jgi:restriction system protein
LLDQTPEEALEYAYEKLHSECSQELLDLIKSRSPEFFESLLIDLLIAMGYGGSWREAGQAMGRSGDGGIDGIINEDILGLDFIYIQAKRYTDNTVPTKEIRDFTGALAFRNAKKGIFITTSRFPKSAYELVEKVEYRIMLIDGERLSNLMIEHNVGLTTTETYHVKAIDSDYFEEG